MKSLNKKVRALLVLLSFAAYMPISMLPSFADAIGANTTPDLNSSINGGYVGLNPADSNKYDVNIDAGKGGVAQFDWNSFNVGSNITVDWIFNNVNQTAVNRVLNSGGMSYIYGKLTSSCGNGGCGNDQTGKVILINPNGIFFGQGAQVNLNSFTASTQDVKLNGQDIRNIADVVKDGGNYMGGIITPDAVGGNTKNYTFTGTDTLTQNGKWGNVISYDPKTTINNYGDGVIGNANFGKITIDGAKFNAQYDEKGQPTTRAAQLAFIADKSIDVKGEAVLQTFVPKAIYDKDGNITGWETPKNHSNWLLDGQPVAISDTKLIVSDGVDLRYDSLGGAAIVKNPIEKAVADATGYGISVTGDSLIWSGNVQITDAVYDSDVVIQDATIIGDKMRGWVAGNIAIRSLRDAIITDSRIETYQASINDTNNNLLPYGNIDVKADRNIIVTNSRLATAGSEQNAVESVKPVGNIKLDAGNGVSINQTKATGTDKYTDKTYTNRISAAGNLDIKAGLTDVVIKGVSTDANWVDGIRDVRIEGRNISIDKTTVAGNNIDIVAGGVDKNNNVSNIITQDGKNYYNGSILINDSKVYAYDNNYTGTYTVDILGLNTTIEDTLLGYDALRFYDADHNNLNNVMITGSTTVLDRTANANNALVLETNGALIIDNNMLQKKYYGDNEAVNQGSDIILRSTDSLVSIRNNSDITAAGSITLDAGTSSSVSTSNVTAGKDIVMNGNTAVTVGNVLTDKQGNNIGTGKGSTLTANNGTIKIHAKGAKANDIQGVTILGASKLTSKDNSITADNGKIAIQDGSVVTATVGNNLIKTDNKDVVIHNATINAKGNNTIESTNNTVSIQEGSTVTAEGNSTVKAKKWAGVQDSQLIAGGKNTITSTTEDVIVTGTGLVKSNNDDVEINQYLTADLDKWYTGKVSAKNNIQLNVTGEGQNIQGSSLGQFTYGNRLGLDANNNINLTKATGDWTLSKVTLNSKNNTIKAENGNVTINNDITLGNKENRTTIEGKNVKTNANSEIRANGKKLIVNADKDIDIAFTGVNNKNAGLEINSNVNTKGTGSIVQSDNNANLIGKNVTLTANDGEMTIAKVKADTLNTHGAIKGAVDNQPNAATDNVGSTAGMVNQGNAYIEVRTAGGWNRDPYYNQVDKKPAFYQNSYDDVDGLAQRHQLLMDNDSENILLVYQRAADCDDPIIDPNPPAGSQASVDTDLTESTLVKLPRHEEGVSAVAPVLNEITDPTANVIMAAARLTLDEDENSEEDEF